MTKHFRDYVTKVLKSNGIGENEDFETSDECFGVLKWSDGTMYTDDGIGVNRLSPSEITWILEESDIEKILKFEEITYFEAMNRLNEWKKLYVDFGQGCDLVSVTEHQNSPNFKKLLVWDDEEKHVTAETDIFYIIDYKFYKLKGGKNVK